MPVSVPELCVLRRARPFLPAEASEAIAIGGAIAMGGRDARDILSFRTLFQARPRLVVTDSRQHSRRARSIIGIGSPIRGGGRPTQHVLRR